MEKKTNLDLNMKTESERQSAVQAFDKIAENYDRHRPDYPEELIQTIVSRANLTAQSKVLEIGAGSGKATALFADYGFEMRCVEPSANMAEKGSGRFRDNKIKFIVSRFEDYAEPREYFDAVIAAQAFHWISQPIGYEKCANSLKKDGYLAPFWKIDLFLLDVDFDRELWAIKTKYDGYVSCMPEGDYPKRVESISSKIAGSGLFSKPEIMHFYREINFTADEYYNYIHTGGGEKTNEACHEELIQLAEKYNGIKRNFHYELYLSQKL